MAVMKKGTVWETTKASQIKNDSGVSGETVADALDNASAAGVTSPDGTKKVVIDNDGNISGEDV